MKSCRVIQTDTFFLHIPGRYVLRSKLFQNFFLPLNYVRKNLSKVKRTAYFSLKDFDIRDSKRAFLQLFSGQCLHLEPARSGKAGTVKISWGHCLSRKRQCPADAPP